MRALITGATGFIGSHVTRLFLKEQAEVAVIIRRGSNTWRIDNALGQVEVFHEDLRNSSAVSALIRQFAPDVVLHLAWAGVTNAHRNDANQIEDNLQSSLDLVRACGEAGCGAFVGLGSQAEYGPQDRAIDEQASVCPTTTYGVVKLCTGLLGDQIARSLSMRFAWIRVFSTYGAEDHASWLIPYVTLELLNDRVPRLTAGEQIWDFLHVEDAARAIWAVASAPEARGVFNLGSGKGYRLRHVIERIRDSIAPGRSLGFGEVPYRPDQVMHLVANISRLQRLAGWSPRIELDEGLLSTVEWFREYNKTMPSLPR